SPGHIHRSVNPPGNPPTDQVGPIVFPLADIAAGVTSAMVDGEWRYDDATNPLTDALVASLMAGELYVNIHSVDHPAGEVRGQLVANAAAVPLPAALPLGVAGMALAGVVARRYRATVR
ncbi:MAG TPA: CHRD domain-containing protein, partial [Tepidisphaeraceae bacterium]|nr:CHRD domain-containing protein [Tepidisphaeraceae bacterium]